MTELCAATATLPVTLLGAQCLVSFDWQVEDLYVLTYKMLASGLVLTATCCLE